MGLSLKSVTDAIIHWLIEDFTEAEAPLCDFERIRYELRPCDVLLCEGRSHVSNVIRLVTQSPWTHSCIYIGRLHDIDDPEVRALVAQHYRGDPSEQLIIEGMLGKGTVVAPLKNYENTHIRICRPDGLSRRDAQSVIEFCVHRLGTKYDVRQIFDLARFFFPWAILPRRWRSSIFSHHPGSYTRTVCSTVIAEAFTNVSFPILPAIKYVNNDSGAENVELYHRNPRLYTPRDFDYSPYFEIIKYPFIQVVEQGLYRQLPWNKEGLIYNDSEIINPNTLPHQRPIKQTVSQTDKTPPVHPSAPESPSETDPKPTPEKESTNQISSPKA
ncbi:MAG: hypothetical protein CMF48_02500 [Legionellales bacterium]|nr:hypothetical protein [Legionellales bacterium]